LVYRKVKFWTNKKAIAKVEMLEPEPCPQLWLILGGDGRSNHAIGVFGEYVFDSNVGTVTEDIGLVFEL
jgi:hypothetical protein